jgi:hypothetical protein
MEHPDFSQAVVGLLVVAVEEELMFQGALAVMAAAVQEVLHILDLEFQEL